MSTLAGMSLTTHTLSELLAVPEAQLAENLLVESRWLRARALNSGGTGPDWRARGNRGVRVQGIRTRPPSLAAKPRGRAAIAVVLASIRPLESRIQKIVCEGLNYCKHKELMGIAFVEALVAALDSMLMGGGLAAVLLLYKQKYFDRLCRCPH